MRIAHLSDLHCLALDGVRASRFLNKRLTGWANLKLKRASKHRAAYVHAIAREIARENVDHVVVTGDLTNLALEGEFELARDVLQHELGLEPARVTIVPGNHDAYTAGAVESRRFESFFSPWLESDLPHLQADVGCGRFPIVKLRGPTAIVALSTAVSQPPLVAAGELGGPQMTAFMRILTHPEVTKRMLVLALHHPVVHAWSRMKAKMEGLRDAPVLLDAMRRLPRALVLHGHLHRREERTITTYLGKLTQVGATSASLHDELPDRMAGFNLYDLDAEGNIENIEARVYDPAKSGFNVRAIPKI
jgi:3',5'-cyclic AMP phosphodiesterase CpdA